MGRRHSQHAALCLGILLLLDVLRVWLPSIITIFGQAASTPAELMGAFALLWFVLALAAPAVIGRVGARPVTLAAAVALAAARIALTAAPGGQVQLYLACVGLLAGLVWLSGVAAGTSRPLPALVAGLALAAVGHAILDTYDLVWREGWLAWSGSALVVVLFLAAQLRAGPGRGGSGGALAWFVLGPTMLLTGMVALSPALAATAVSYLAGDGAVARSVGLADLPQGLLAGAATGLFVWAALGRPSGPAGSAAAGATGRGGWLLHWAGPVCLVGGALLFAFGLDATAVLAPAILLTAAGAGACLALLARPAGPGQASARHDQAGATSEAATGAASVDSRGDAARRGYAVLGGLSVFAVATVAYYASYDLGYPNGAVPVVVALLVAVPAWWASRNSRPAAVDDAPSGRRRWAVPAFAGTLLVLTVGASPLTPSPGGPTPAPTGDRPPAVGSTSSAGPVRLVAYNIRMGYGLDGRFDLDGLAGVLRAQRPDLVVLSEVDRAWLLNGGHDTLALLARRLDLPYLFAPAADPVWGDAVLTRAPVRAVRSWRLPAVGAPTGAQALAVTVELAGRELVVVSTHLQPPPGEQPLVQAREVARLATSYAAGRPLVVAGDLNTQPGEAAFAELTRAGLVDALAASRPLPTSPADVPTEQIDHVLTSPGIVASEVTVPRSTASDHLPVAVTLTLP